MKVKTSELKGAALDWAVAQCEGKDRDCEIHAGIVLHGRVTSGFIQYLPSADWSLCGPIIEREGISLDYRPPGGSSDWYAEIADERIAWSRGDTPLIAAMRCYVASKLGEEVEVPEELI